MHLHPVFIVAAMTLCSFGAGLCAKQFSLTRDVLWLVATFSLYALSNCFFILVIDQAGLARAVIYSGAVGIALNVIAGIYFRENLGPLNFIAAALVCIALALPLLSPSLRPDADTSETPETNESDPS